MVQLEPDGLAVVGALARRLVEQPLPGVLGLGAPRREADLSRRVVPLHQVLEDGARLPQHQVPALVVRVPDRREPPVRVHRQVRWPLDVREGDVFELVRHAELLEYDGYFGRVRAVLAVDADGLEVGVGHFCC